MTVPPLTDAEFADLMAPLGPFERAPRLAVAVSGGADSLALCLFAHRWASAQGGEAVGLTVDHRLRPEAAGEAARVSRWLADRGIPHQTLRWTGAKPSTGIQARARRARYALLGESCREAGILHLLLAHHQSDQAETLLLRLARGSGVDGLSAMAPVSTMADVRLLRPLLSVPRERLTAALAAQGQPWIEDPSNANLAFRRVRVRRMLPELAAEGLTPQRLAATAQRLGRARRALDLASTDLLVAAVELDARGFARLDAAALGRAPDEIALRVLARLCRTIGGGVYPPRLERLERLLGEVLGGLDGARTFGGCVLAPADDALLVWRELAAIGPSQTVSTAGSFLWDNRFALHLAGSGTARIDALGEDGWRKIRDKVAPPLIPPPVVATLPALFDDNGVFSAPHLGYKRGVPIGLTVEQVAFAPIQPLAGAAGWLV
jgi:tRNA(Ile)-lysidine synthase